MHKARVQVQSKVGKGTAFIITFPPYRKPSHVAPDGAHEAEVVENVHPEPEDVSFEQEEIHEKD